MARGQSRRVGETLRRIDVLALVHHGQESSVPAVDRDREKGLFPRRDFTPPVGRDVRKQIRQQMRPLPTQHVVHRHRAHEQRITAFARFVETEQSDHVGRIRMKSLPLARLVDPDVGIAAVGADIADMSQEVAGCVLRSCATEVRPDAAKDRRRELRADPIDGESLYQLEANAMKQSFAQGSELRLQRRQRERLGRELRELAVARKKRPRGALELGDLRRRQAPSPGVGDPTDLLPDPGRGDIEAFGWRWNSHCLRAGPGSRNDLPGTESVVYIQSRMGGHRNARGVRRRESWPGSPCGARRTPSRRTTRRVREGSARGSPTR